MTDKHVELSTVFFYKKGEKPPSEVNLSDCGPPVLTQNEESITCLYGLRHRRQGFKQIHDYAESNGLNYEVVDMRLPVKEAPTATDFDDLGKQDVLSLARISGSVKEAMYEGMSISAALSRTEQQSKLIDRISAEPDAIQKLRETLKSEQVPLVIHPTRLRENSEALAVANLAKSSCHALKDINCRTENNIKIHNDLTGVSNKVAHTEDNKGAPVKPQSSSRMK